MCHVSRFRSTYGGLHFAYSAAEYPYYSFVLGFRNPPLSPPDAEGSPYGRPVCLCMQIDAEALFGPLDRFATIV